MKISELITKHILIDQWFYYHNSDVTKIRQTCENACKHNQVLKNYSFMFNLCYSNCFTFYMIECNLTYFTKASNPLLTAVPHIASMRSQILISFESLPWSSKDCPGPPLYHPWFGRLCHQYPGSPEDRLASHACRSGCSAQLRPGQLEISAQDQRSPPQHQGIQSIQQQRLPKRRFARRKRPAYSLW